MKRKFNKIGAVMLTLCMAVSLGIMYPARVYAEVTEPVVVPDGETVVVDDDVNVDLGNGGNAAVDVGKNASATVGDITATTTDDSVETVTGLHVGEGSTATAGDVTVTGNGISAGVVSDIGSSSFETGNITVEGRTAIGIQALDPEEEAAISAKDVKVTSTDTDGDAYGLYLVGMGDPSDFKGQHKISVDIDNLTLESAGKYERWRNAYGIIAYFEEYGPDTLSLNADNVSIKAASNVYGSQCLFFQGSTELYTKDFIVHTTEGNAAGVAIQTPGSAEFQGMGKHTVLIDGDLKVSSDASTGFSIEGPDGMGSIGMIFFPDSLSGDFQAQVNGDLEADLGFYAFNAYGNCDILVDGTIKGKIPFLVYTIPSDSEYAEYVTQARAAKRDIMNNLSEEEKAAYDGKLADYSSDNARHEFTVWKLEADNEDGILFMGAPDEASRQQVEKGINYIIHIAEDSADKITAKGEAGKVVTGLDGTEFDTALAGELVELKAQDGYRIVSAKNIGEGFEADITPDANGKFFYNVVRGGGILLSAVVEAIQNEDPTPTPTPDPTPTPTPTPAPAGGGGAAGGGAATPVVAATAAPTDMAIADNDVPLAANEPAEAEEIIDDAVPMSAPEGGWSLVNLLAALASALLSVVGLGKRKEQIGAALKYSGLAPAVAAIATFILTSDLTQPMQMTNKYTPLMIGIAAIGACIAIVAQVKNNNEEEAEA